MEKNEIKENLKNTNTWLRLLFMLLFIVFLGAAMNIFAIILLFQVLLSLFTGETNQRVRTFSSQLSRYVYQVLVYLSYATEDRPFPFAEWPEAETDSEYDSRLPTSLDDSD